MAIRIRGFSHQNILVGAPYRMNVRIRGGPSRVRVDGLPDGFYYHWNESRGRVQIRGTPEVLVYDKQMIITADDEIYRQTYSVIPALPGYDTSIERTVIKGVLFSISIPVTSELSGVDIQGPWAGLNYYHYASRFDLFGTIPANSNFTRNSLEYDVTVYNSAGDTNGSITLNLLELSDTKFYILDGDGSVPNTKVKVYNSAVPLEGVNQSVTKIKEFNLPTISGATANYVAIANDGTNLYLLHSAGPSSSASNLDDKIVVVSPATQDGQTAGIIRQFDITRTSHYYTHDIDDIYYYDGKLYILTSWGTETTRQTYFVLEDITGNDPTRIISLHGRGGGISITKGLVTAVLFNRVSPNQGSYFRIYPPGYTEGTVLISESSQVYTTHDVIRADFAINTNDVSMTSINNFAYILSSTLPGVISTVEVPTNVGIPIRRGEISLTPALTRPTGITHL